MNCLQEDEKEMKNHLFKHLAALETISDFFKFLQICQKAGSLPRISILNNYLFKRKCSTWYPSWEHSFVKIIKLRVNTSQSVSVQISSLSLSTPHRNKSINYKNYESFKWITWKMPASQPRSVTRHTFLTRYFFC